VIHIWQAIILGLTQGFTEFAPISSSGHLILVPWIFDWPILNDAAFNKTFDVALHLGTLIGALIYFRHEVVTYTVAWFRSVAHRRISGPDEKIAWALVIGTIPGALAGATLEGPIQEHLGAPLLIAVMLTVFALILYVVDRVAPVRRGMEDMTVGRGLWFGIAQALALQPGVSRSGVTMTAGRLLGFDRSSAAKFSFMLSLPIIAGAGLYKGVDVVKTGIPSDLVWPFFWGVVASALSGFLVIWFLLAYLRKHNFGLFLWYRVGVSCLVFLLIATGARPATI
jgi:undecaprenyl-diphosphatase